MDAKETVSAATTSTPVVTTATTRAFNGFNNRNISSSSNSSIVNLPFRTDPPLSTSTTIHQTSSPASTPLGPAAMSPFQWAGGFDQGSRKRATTPMPQFSNYLTLQTPPAHTTTIAGSLPLSGGGGGGAAGAAFPSTGFRFCTLQLLNTSSCSSTAFAADDSSSRDAKRPSYYGAAPAYSSPFLPSTFTSSLGLFGGGAPCQPNLDQPQTQTQMQPLQATQEARAGGFE